MAEYPALPLFTDAFIADTTHLDATETGAYLMLLIVAWRTDDCALPNDDKILARYARLEIKKWMRVKDSVLSFWKIGDDGKLRQGRLTDEKKFVMDTSHKQSQNIKARWLKNKNTGDTTVYTKPIPNAYQTDTPHPHPHPKEKEPPKGGKKNQAVKITAPTNEFILPDWVPKQDWDDWMEVRKNKKAPNTLRALNLAISTLEKLQAQGNDPALVLQKSIMAGYLGLFPLTNQKGKNYEKPSVEDALNTVASDIAKDALFSSYDGSEDEGSVIDADFAYVKGN